MKSRINAWLLLGLLVTGFSACDDDEEEVSRTVEGRWQGTRMEFTLEAFGIPVRNEDDDSFNAILEFKANGSVTIEDEGQSATGTWVQNGNTLTLSVNYTIENISLSGDYTIKELTDTKLAIYAERDETYEDPDTGLEVDGTLKATLYFTAIP